MKSLSAITLLLLLSFVGCAAPGVALDEPVTGDDKNNDDNSTKLDDPNGAKPADPNAQQPTPAEGGAARPDGSFKFVSYNVGGLADALSAGSPSKTMPLISPLLNPYDLVVVQEDFEYHDKLASQVTHQFGVKPNKAGSFTSFYGDGLAAFSRLSLGTADHKTWNDCNGTFGSKNDCLADKGFVRVVATVAPGKEIDIYNLHMDAGRSGDDGKARDKQASQLAEYIAQHSVGRALIIAGDTNMKDDDETSFTRFLGLITSLRDTCRELNCPKPDLHDRVLIRDGANLKLTPSNWRWETNFRTSDGQPLSDHEPVAVDIGWTVIP
jgi:hypothetical protein